MEFKRIVAYKGPLNDPHPNYKGYHFNVMFVQEKGETITKPLYIIEANNPVTCDMYADEKFLLQYEGW